MSRRLYVVNCPQLLKERNLDHSISKQLSVVGCHVLYQGAEELCAPWGENLSATTHIRLASAAEAELFLVLSHGLTNAATSRIPLKEAEHITLQLRVDYFQPYFNFGLVWFAQILTLDGAQSSPLWNLDRDQIHMWDLEHFKGSLPF